MKTDWSINVLLGFANYTIYYLIGTTLDFWFNLSFWNTTLVVALVGIPVAMAHNWYWIKRLYNVES